MKCTHHWLLTSAVVQEAYAARCILCGAERTFPTVDWENPHSVWSISRTRTSRKPPQLET